MNRSEISRGRIRVGTVLAVVMLSVMAACSAGGGDGEVSEAVDRGEGAAPVSDGAGSEAGSDAESADGETSDDEGGDDGMPVPAVTATYEPARGTASLTDIGDRDEVCAWIDISEIDGLADEAPLETDGWTNTGEDVQCLYEREGHYVWVHMTYQPAEPDLDLLREITDAHPFVEWIEELEDLGEQAVVFQKAMGAAEVNAIDGDLWVTAAVDIGSADDAYSDAERSQQVAVDLVLQGLRAE